MPIKIYKNCKIKNNLIKIIFNKQRVNILNIYKVGPCLILVLDSWK